MIYQLKWNANDTAGYIVNDIYPKGYVFEDPLLKPILANTAYESLIYDELTNTYTLIINSVETDMTAAQKIEVLNACSGWVDTTYIYEELAFDIHVKNKKTALKAFFNTSVEQMVPNVTAHEMASWRKQEEEARAWVVDTTAPTPMIDILLVARDLGEAKVELVDKIILNADANLEIYSEYLGRFQKAIRLVDAATTKEELQAIGF